MLVPGAFPDERWCSQDKMASPKRVIKPTHARSPYWEYFGFEVDDKGEKLNRSVVVCKLCQKNVAYSNNTTNLRQHLESAHREVLPGPSSGPKGKQATLQQALSGTKMLAKDSSRAHAITQSLAEFIVRDMRPISTVEGAGFLKFMSVIEPRYEVPSRKHLSAVVTSMYTEAKVKVTEELDAATAVAITADFWTSVATDSYLGVTAHFISPSWQLESRVLQTREMTEQHTGWYFTSIPYRNSVLS